MNLADRVQISVGAVAFEKGMNPFIPTAIMWQTELAIGQFI